jgi:hypothetical protein
MTTRRNFLKGAAAGGIVFCSCEHIMGTKTLSDKDKAAILGLNAAKLFAVKVA